LKQSQKQTERRPIRVGNGSSACGFLLVAFTLLVASCVKPESTVPEPTPTPDPVANRQDCGQIYGSPYHSEEERDWFMSNCLKWPYFSAPDPPAPPASATDAPPGTPGSPQTSLPPGTPGDRTNCNEIRGTPYRSDTERLWYLSNCQGASPQGGLPPSGPTAAPGPDRTDCNAIRGTPYQSDAERAWFRQNCPPPPG